MSTEDQKSAIVAEAAQVAFQVTETAAATAKDVMATAVETAHQVRQNEQDDDDRIARALVTALDAVFGQNVERQRFVDVSKIPLLCRSIVDIHVSIKEINEKLDTKFVTKTEFSLVQRIVYGFVSLILVSFMVGLISLIYIK
jgi:hypothetical protein